MDNLQQDMLGLRRELMKVAQQMVTEASDTIFQVILATAGEDRAKALRGVEALNKDMIRNINLYYDGIDEGGFDA